MQLRSFLKLKSPGCRSGSPRDGSGLKIEFGEFDSDTHVDIGQDRRKRGVFGGLETLRPFDDRLEPGRANHAGDDLAVEAVELVDPAVPVDMPDENMPLEPDRIVEIAAGTVDATAILGATAARAASPGGAKGYLAAPYVQGKDEPVNLTADYDKMLSYKDKYRGERCFVIGNGPSLNKNDLDVNYMLYGIR